MISKVNSTFDGNLPWICNHCDPTAGAIDIAGASDTAEEMRGTVGGIGRVGEARGMVGVVVEVRRGRGWGERETLKEGVVGVVGEAATVDLVGMVEVAAAVDLVGVVEDLVTTFFLVVWRKAIGISGVSKF